MSDVLGAIHEFTSLAMLRLKGELPLEDRSRLEQLEDLLRDQIDGAHPAPRRIENPTAAQVSRPPPAVKPANVVVSRRPAQTSAPPPPASPDDATLGGQLNALAERLELNERDRSKITEVRASDLPRNSYTPSLTPHYLADYYSDDIARTLDIPEPPARAVTAEGEAPELAEEVKILFGLAVPKSPPRKATAQTEPLRVVNPRRESTTAAINATTRGSTPMPRVSAAAPKPSTPSQPPAVVHLLSGSSKRGDLVTFEPDAGNIVVRLPSGEEETMVFEDVFAVFVGLPKGGTPSAASGTRMIVKLLNEKELIGCSPDYAPGAGAMTLIPDDRRSVDRVWIPAWSVTEIRFA